MGSALGKYLSMTSSTNWNDIVNKLKGVSIGTRQGSQSSTKDYWTAAAGNLTFLTRIDIDATGVYNNGRSQGRSDVTSNPNGYGLYTKSQYDSNWSNGYNSGRGNIRVVTGSVVSSSTENVNYSGGYKNRAVVAFNPGGNPLMAYARRQWDNHAVFHASNGTFYISSSSIWDVSSWHDFNSSSVHLPTDTSGTDKTWSYWCAIY